MATRLIDGHVHLRTTGDIDGFVEIIERSGLSAVNLACILRGENVHINCASLLFKQHHAPTAYVCGGLDHSVEAATEGKADFAAQARRLVELGADGMKMLEGKPDMRKAWQLPLDSPAYDSYYRYLQDASIPVLFHVADPEEFWSPEKAPDFARKSGWYWGEGDYPSKEQLYREAEGVVKKYPGLQIVFAHFFFLSADIRRAARFLDTYPNVYFDITPGWEMHYNFSKRSDEWRDFFTSYAQRIVFGTDNTAFSQENRDGAVECIATLRRLLETKDEMLDGKGLGLGEETLDAIYHANFERVFGAAPKALDPDGLKNECEAAVKRASAAFGETDAVAQLRDVLSRLG